jgi:hypothetical protein
MTHEELAALDAELAPMLVTSEREALYNIQQQEAEAREATRATMGAWLAPVGLLALMLLLLPGMRYR